MTGLLCCLENYFGITSVNNGNDQKVVEIWMDQPVVKIIIHGLVHSTFRPFSTFFDHFRAGTIELASHSSNAMYFPCDFACVCSGN